VEDVRSADVEEKSAVVDDVRSAEEALCWGFSPTYTRLSWHG
jgi:hypothetical protein